MKRWRVAFCAALACTGMSVVGVFAAPALAQSNEATECSVATPPETPSNPAQVQAAGDAAYEAQQNTITPIPTDGHANPYTYLGWETEETPPPTTVPVISPGTLSKDCEIVPAGVQRVGGPFKLANEYSVAVVDSGTAKLPFLNLLPGVNCSGDGGTDLGTNDTVGHGTHLSGIIGGMSFKGVGVDGVIPGVPIVPVRVGGSLGISDETIDCGLQWVLDNHSKVVPPIRVVNMSLGRVVDPWEMSDDGHCGMVNGDVMHQLICKLKEAGVATVVAAGNSTVDASLFVPAGYREVLTVSAFADTDGIRGGLGVAPHAEMPKFFADDSFAFFSNYGLAVRIAGPGVQIASFLPDGQIHFEDGTSMAAPHVTAIVLLESSRFPEGAVDVDQVFNQVINNAESYPANGVRNVVNDLHQEPLAQGVAVTSYEPPALAAKVLDQVSETFALAA